VDQPPTKQQSCRDKGPNSSTVPAALRKPDRSARIRIGTGGIPAILIDPQAKDRPNILSPLSAASPGASPHGRLPPRRRGNIRSCPDAISRPGNGGISSLRLGNWLWLISWILRRTAHSRARPSPSQASRAARIKDHTTPSDANGSNHRASIGETAPSLRPSGPSVSSAICSASRAQHSGRELGSSN